MFWKFKTEQILERTLQIGLAGSFLIVATILSLPPEPRGASQPLPIAQQLAVIENKIREVPVSKAKAPWSASRSIVSKAGSMTSVTDFLNLNLNPAERELINRMQTDEFAKGNPFYSLNNVYPVALILEQEVVGFEREVFRSAHFLDGYGYDLVKYEIRLRTGLTSYILAYRDKTESAQVAVGREDSRPIFTLFIVPQDENQVFRSLYQDGEPVANQTVARADALADISERISQSTPLLSARHNPEP